MTNQALTEFRALCMLYDTYCGKHPESQFEGVEVFNFVVDQLLHPNRVLTSELEAPEELYKTVPSDEVLATCSASLRDQFRASLKGSSTTESFLLDTNSNYITWLENKVKKG